MCHHITVINYSYQTFSVNSTKLPRTSFNWIHKYDVISHHDKPMSVSTSFNASKCYDYTLACSYLQLSRGLLDIAYMLLWTFPSNDNIIEQQHNVSSNAHHPIATSQGLVWKLFDSLERKAKTRIRDGFGCNYRCTARLLAEYPSVHWTVGIFSPLYLTITTQ